MKKGQVTIFIIIGIIVVAVVGLLFYYRGFIQKASVEKEVVKGIVVAPEIQDFADFLGDCVRDVGGLSMDFVFAQGGLWKPLPYFSQGPLEVSYWYYEGKDTSPPIKEVENSLSEFVDFYLPECLSEFDKVDMLVVGVDPKTKVALTNKGVRFEVSYPASVSYKDTFFSLPEEPVVAEFLSDFKSVYEAGREVVKFQLADPDFIDVTSLTMLGQDITYLPRANNEGLYLISGKTTSLMFANKFLRNETLENELFGKKEEKQEEFFWEELTEGVGNESLEK